MNLACDLNVFSTEGSGSVLPTIFMSDPEVRFEQWTIFEGYLQAEIFEEYLWSFGQAVIFNAFSYISKIKDKKQTEINLILAQVISKFVKGFN